MNDEICRWKFPGEISSITPMQKKRVAMAPIYRVVPLAANVRRTKQKSSNDCSLLLFDSLLYSW
jgi:hypothetical protein